jgi:hypothetical protein
MLSKVSIGAHVEIEIRIGIVLVLSGRISRVVPVALDGTSSLASQAQFQMDAEAAGMLALDSSHIRA